MAAQDLAGVVRARVTMPATVFLLRSAGDAQRVGSVGRGRSYRLVGRAAIKVVGVGSVGCRCWIALLLSVSNDPLFLQFNEAV